MPPIGDSPLPPPMSAPPHAIPAPATPALDKRKEDYFRKYQPPEGSVQVWVPKACAKIFINDIEIPMKVIQSSLDKGDEKGWNIVFVTEPNEPGKSIGLLMGTFDE